MIYDIIKIVGLVFILMAVLFALIKWGIIIRYIISGLKNGFYQDEKETKKEEDANG